MDILANDEEELGKYKSAYQQYKEIIRQLEKLKDDAERNKADEDYIRFQLEQLDEAKLSEDEQEFWSKKLTY